jgi:hypothetical protein
MSQSNQLIRIRLNWFQKALLETSSTPKAGLSKQRTMQLMRSGTRCQLPRGFVKGRKNRSLWG